MTPAGTHECGLRLPAGGTCRARVPDGWLFDPPHWRLVPAEIAAKVRQAQAGGAGTEEHARYCQLARDAAEETLLAQAAEPRTARPSGRGRNAGRRARRTPRGTVAR